VAPRSTFKTVLTRARVNYSGLKPGDMKDIGEEAKRSILYRFNLAQTTYDTAAPPLVPRWADFKAKRGRAPIRDLNWTGRLRRGLNVLRADHNNAYIGFSDPEARRRMAFNQRRSAMWGLSPLDRATIDRKVSAVFRQKVTIESKKVA
jgi:hypothetical protein